MADVIDVSPETPNLEVMLAKFNREHWHDEDEVRFIIRGAGFPPSPLTFPAASIPPQGAKPIHIAIKNCKDSAAVAI
jgi:1,2-dihydroxy-3-keto-5-methylthiopentene dioxygenase